MRRILFFATLLSLLFHTACSDSNDISNLKAKGNARYGGVFRFMSAEKITTLLPLSSSSIYNQRVGSQMFETLLKVDPVSNEIVPSIAESFKVNEDATKFTFKIRKGVFFHDDACFSGDKGRELTAHDVKNTLEFACSKTVDNEIYWLLISKIKGAKSYYTLSKKGEVPKNLSAIKVIDNNTLSIELAYSFIGFDKLLVHHSLGIFPKEAYEKYGVELGKHPVGTGAFLLEEWSDDKLILARNSNYWMKDNLGNQLPFLANIEVSYSKDKKAELLAFRNKSIDLVMDIHVDQIDNMIGDLKTAIAGKTVKHKIDIREALGSAYFGFANTTPPFNNVDVRKAFNLAIDRLDLIENTLQGEGTPSLHGFVPKILDYNDTLVKGFPFDVVRAKQLLAKAGFPNGSGFPTVKLYVNAKVGTASYKAAVGVCKQLKQNLNVNVVLNLCSIEARDKAILSGEAKMWRGGWIADYPDPENFLNLFFSENISNSSVISNPFKYSNKLFDRNFKLAMRERNPNKRRNLFVQCDQQIINDAVVMPLFHQDFMTMVNFRVKNFVTNPTEIIDFSRMFIREPKN
jgi:peptide/nickel transport system substrate-binding protein